MGALLVQSWLGEGPSVDTRDEASVSLVRGAVRAAAATAGLAVERAEALATAASELAHNQLRHARIGGVAVRPIARDGVAGVEVIAADRGPGIADVPAALRGRAADATSLGGGLGGAARLADELDLDVRRGEGTCVRVRAFAAPVARREVAVVCRPHPGEPVAGDHAVVVHEPTRLLIAAADGLGHGPAARDAADRALSEIAPGWSGGPAALLARCDRAAAGSRGAAAALAELDFAAGELRCAGAGNVGVHSYHHRKAQRFASVARVVGARTPTPWRAPEEVVPIEHPGLLVVFTDGLSSRLDLADDLELQRQHPGAIAQRLLERHLTPSPDDALVVVARWA